MRLLPLSGKAREDPDHQQQLAQSGHRWKDHERERGSCKGIYTLVKRSRRRELANRVQGRAKAGDDQDQAVQNQPVAATREAQLQAWQRSIEYG